MGTGYPYWQPRLRCFYASDVFFQKGGVKPLGEIFCDLHDRPERMKAKGVIREIVPWKLARHFFFWRLKRRFEELRLATALVIDGRALSYEQAVKLVHNAVSGAATDKTAFETLEMFKVDDIP